MGFLVQVFISLGLAMDAFAVSVSNGICYRRAGFKEAFYTALTFGLFQAGMPLIGYFAGRTISDYVEFIDHWIALALLGFIGGNMIFSGFRELRKPEKTPCPTTCRFKDLVVQGIATSIDALAVGVSLAVIKTNIFEAVTLIGIITFVSCMIGVYIGRGFGSMLKEKAEIFGGIILVIIGLKIFIEHTVNGI